MKLFVTLIAAMLVMVSTAALASDKARQEEQARLDAACDEVRQELLAPAKQSAIDECIAVEKNNKKQKDPEGYCNRFYADFGERSGNRQGLFMDVPECQAAYEYQQSTRSSR